MVKSRKQSVYKLYLGEGVGQSRQIKAICEIYRWRLLRGDRE